MTTDLRRLVLHDVAQVLQLLAANSALLVSGSTKTSEDKDVGESVRLKRVSFSDRTKRH